MLYLCYYCSIFHKKELSFLSIQEYNNYKALYLQANPTLNGVNCIFFVSKTIIIDENNFN